MSRGRQHQQQKRLILVDLPIKGHKRYFLSVTDLLVAGEGGCVPTTTTRRRHNSPGIITNTVVSTDLCAA
jgi:hypothetical protein